MSAAPAFAPITELAARLRRGEFDALELVEIFAERIEAHGDTSRAFISLDLDGARERARATRIEAGDSILKGIPYACKDLFDVSGVATTGGSRVLQDNVAARDAEVVRRLAHAGANFLGKTNLHEFAYGATGENEIYGTCPNPYDRQRLAGGSSSGSAAALGFGLCAATLGTDTGGSVRAPAALCGLVGFKPTFGRVSTEGVIPFSWSLDHVGTMTRSAADAALLFEAMAEDFRPPAKPRLDELAIGIPESFFFERCDGEILDALEALKALLGRSGARIETVAVPSMEFTRTVSLTVQMPEALSYHNRFLDTRGELYSPDFRAGLALGQNLLAEQYVRARRFIESYRRGLNAVFAEVDVLLTPATPVVAPEIGAVEISVDGISEPAGNAITRYTSFFNMTGHPAITLPCGLHRSGLPIGAQLVGRHYADEALLETARLIEQKLGFEPAPPVL